MSSFTAATRTAARSFRSAPARRQLSSLGVALTLVCACAIDDRTLQNGRLALTRSDAGDAGARAADAGLDAADTEILPGRDPDRPEQPDEPKAPEPPRPIRALGEAVSTELVGGPTG